MDGVLNKSRPRRIAGLLVATFALLTSALFMPAVASAATTGPSAVGNGTYLYSGHIWKPGGLDVTAGLTRLNYQGDGNLVLECTYGKVLWASSTAGATHNATLNYQNDGNLVIYNNGATAIWASGTNGHSSDFAVVQVDNNFVIYDGTNWIWATNTNNRC